ncbi:hypothetical protein Taro_010799 [Colocasia esculenta]|uniref:Uncharacterized protein n=1 Tax=Colocasia esculenta TaxID=4460 RepID=A0A843U4C2_COLES|nr:hypothetical protein [Colocasia esculenta]
MERQLDLSFVAARLRVGKRLLLSYLCWVCSVLGEFPTEPVTSEAHPYPPQVRARRTFLGRRPVRSRVIAVQGQHLQQCSVGQHLQQCSVVSCLLLPAVPRGMPQALVLSFSFVEIWLCKFVKYIYGMVCSFVFSRTVV